MTTSFIIIVLLTFIVVIFIPKHQKVNQNDGNGQHKNQDESSLQDTAGSTSSAFRRMPSIIARFGVQTDARKWYIGMCVVFAWYFVVWNYILIFFLRYRKICDGIIIFMNAIRFKLFVWLFEDVLSGLYYIIKACPTMQPRILYAYGSD